MYFEMPATPPPFPLPAASVETAFFWASGRDGVLRMARCSACRYIVHPPGPRCPACGSGEVAPAELSGRGSVYAFTISVQPFVPGLGPYCLALVELEEQADVRLLARLVDAHAADLAVGMPVEVVFQRMSDDVWVPCFRPAASRPAAAGAAS
jgi:uncharacterized protein